MLPSSLPIQQILPQLLSTLDEERNVLLCADPGAGKTTRVPLAVSELPLLKDKKIIMLEPRRLAARYAASYMSKLLGEEVGETVGYRIRGTAKVGKRTRIEVVTEGILTRMLQADPALPGVGMLIFDEFHERSIHADLGLALSLDVQTHLRNDLRIVIMSATLDDTSLVALLGGAPVVRSEGRQFPVTTQYLARDPDGEIEPVVVSAVLRALREEPGDLLLFLPGQREIRRVAERLEGEGVPEDVTIHMLYGESPIVQQQAALEPAKQGNRKVILSTSIAETSLTIDGVRVVIDSGLARSARFDPRRGMSGLVTTRVSRAGADQRRGRAGRQMPGACYRLWTEARHSELQPFAPPEILVADLAPVAIDLAKWGAPMGEGLLFLNPPPVPHLLQARDLLKQLGALDGGEKLTAHGKEMAGLPVHPRLAHMLIKGKTMGLGALASEIAALLDDRFTTRGDRKGEVDLHTRWHAARRSREISERLKAESDRLRKMIGAGNEPPDEEKIGLLLAMAYPERVAKSRAPGSSRYLLAGGAGGVLPKGSLLSRHRYLAVGDVDGIGSEVTIFLAEPVSEEDLRKVFADQIVRVDEVRWDDQAEEVAARRIEKLGELELSSVPAPAHGLETVMIEGIRRMGLSVLPWTKEALAVRTRSEWLRRRGLVGDDWPRLGDDDLLVGMNDWLAPWLGGITRKAHLGRLDMAAIIGAMFTHRQLRELEELAPTHLPVPTGSRIALTYNADSTPVLAVRLQEMFGQTETPAIARGAVKVVLHLLSPARRPLAVTQDLPSFWKNVYPEVRKDMRGRYPKHFWPENPLEAEPTRRTKRR